MKSNFWLSSDFCKKDVFWLGLRKERLSDPWRWLDGSRYDFTRWTDGIQDYSGENGSSGDGMMFDESPMCVFGNWNHLGQWRATLCEGYKAKVACSYEL